MPPYKPLRQRLEEKTAPPNERGCRLFTGAKNDDGYGTIGDEAPSRKIVKTHRVMWQLIYGAIPSGQLVLHSCDNPPCLEPTHLFLGDDKANCDDMIAKGGARHPGGEALACSVLTAEEVASIRALAKARAMPQEKIAALFGVTQGNISHIKNGRTWR